MDVLTTMLFARAAYRSAYTPPAIGSGNALRAQNIANQTEARLDRALLTMEAMWILMREHLDVTDEKLRALITEIDLSDGQIDGRARRSVMECPNCSRKISPRFPRWMYCGADVPHDPFS